MSRHARDALLVTSGISKDAVQSDFAAAYLKKFGWNEGDALGAEKQGVAEPVQIRRRAENLGVGAEKQKAAIYNPWWEDLYNKSTSNVKTAVSSDPVSDSDSDSDNEPIRPSAESKAVKKDEKKKAAAITKMTPRELLHLCRNPRHIAARS